MEHVGKKGTPLGRFNPSVVNVEHLKILNLNFGLTTKKQSCKNTLVMIEEEKMSKDLKDYLKYICIICNLICFKYNPFYFRRQLQ